MLGCGARTKDVSSVFQVRRACRAESAVAACASADPAIVPMASAERSMSANRSSRDPLGPGMARQYIGPAQGDVVGKRCAGLGEDLLEDVGQGENRWAGIHPDAADFHLTHLAAGPVGFFDDGHLQPMERQPQGGGQTGDAGSNDDNSFCLLHHASGPRMSLIVTDSSVNNI